MASVRAASAWAHTLSTFMHTVANRYGDDEVVAVLGPERWSTLKAVQVRTSIRILGYRLQCGRQ